MVINQSYDSFPEVPARIAVPESAEAVEHGDDVGDARLRQPRPGRGLHRPHALLHRLQEEQVPALPTEHLTILTAECGQVSRSSRCDAFLFHFFEVPVRKFLVELGVLNAILLIMVTW